MIAERQFGIRKAECGLAGRRYWFHLRTGKLWCGTLCHSCDKLVVLIDAVELTELRQKKARAFFTADVVAAGELVQ